jgi:hypothetical protein
MELEVVAMVQEPRVPDKWDILLLEKRWKDDVTDYLIVSVNTSIQINFVPFHTVLCHNEIILLV